MLSIEFEDLEVSYGGPARSAGNRIFARLCGDFSLEAGEILGLMGESGSGKSTLLRLIAKVLRPTGGNIRMQGVTKDEIAYLPQGGVILDHLTLEQNIRLFERLRATRARFDKERLAAAIRTLNLERLLKDERSVENLSGGEKQRISLARILSVHPKLVLLDEPGAGLGGDLRREFLVALKRSATELSFCAIIASHEWHDHLLVANQVAFLKQSDGRGLSTIPMTDVRAFARAPWHREAVAYTSADPVVWLDGQRQASGR